MHMIAVQQIVPASVLHGCWLAGVLLPVMTTLDDDSLLAQSPPWSVVSCLVRPSRPASARCTPMIELFTTCSFVALAPELQMCGRSDRNPLRFCDTLGKNMYHTHGQCGSPLSLKGIALTRDSTFTSRRYARARVRALSGVKAPRRHPSTCGRGSALRRSAVSPQMASLPAQRGALGACGGFRHIHVYGTKSRLYVLGQQPGGSTRVLKFRRQSGPRLDVVQDPLHYSAEQANAVLRRLHEQAGGLQLIAKACRTYCGWQIFLHATPLSPPRALDHVPLPKF